MVVLYAKSAAELLLDPRHTRKLSTGCAVLDECLGGGINAHGITEIAGAAGVGKTQLVLQLMLQVTATASATAAAAGAGKRRPAVSTTVAMIVDGAFSSHQHQ